MKDLNEILKFMFPNVSHDVFSKNPSWIITANKNGQTITKWALQNTKQPTKSELETAYEKMILVNKQKNKLSSIQVTYQTESIKPISYKEVLYKGGDTSASAIAGAVQLAQSLGESNVKIIASDDSTNEMSFDEALELSGLIAKAWRTAFFRYKELKVQISNAATVEELESISWEEV